MVGIYQCWESLWFSVLKSRVQCGDFFDLNLSSHYFVGTSIWTEHWNKSSTNLYPKLESWKNIILEKRDRFFKYTSWFGFRKVDKQAQFCWPCLTKIGKDIMFRFIIEYSSLKDFDPEVIGLFLYEDFWKMIFWLVLKLEITYRVVISWRSLVLFQGFLEGYIFVWWNIWVSIILLLP